AVRARSRSSRQKPCRTQDQFPKREFVGRRYSPAGTGRGESRNQLPGGLGSLTNANPQNDPPGRRTQSDHRGGGSLEQIPAESARIRALHRLVSKPLGARL